MGPIDLTHSPHARLRPLTARISGGFWAARQRLNRERLLPDGEQRLDEAGNFHDLRAAAGEAEGFRGLLFTDSDLYKWVEALGWELGREPSPELAERADRAIGLIEAAQDADGYLNSYYQVVAPRERFSNLAWDHELYCAGHLIQAGIAHARARDAGRLLAVGCRFAEHIAPLGAPDGHPEIELALIELARLTGTSRYRDHAARLLDARGHGALHPASFGAAYFQDHVPVRDAREVAGHAVRALYLAAGVTDLYLETGEAALLAAVREQWHDMAGRKTYLTGGVGAHHSGEAFGDAYELPPDRAYAETCAAIASVMWSWRMLLATGDARYADLMERTLYNGFLAGIALDGSGYSYVNPLHVRGAHQRYRWFPCACCPPNVMRLLASLHHYVATADADGVQLHHYATGAAGPLRVATGYPFDGRVEIEVAEPGARTLSLRVPAWAQRATLDGEPVAAGGYARVRRDWRAGDIVTLELPLAPRLTAPHPRIDAVRGCLAIERGPLVYCFEASDVAPGARLDDLRLDQAAVPTDADRPDLLGGIVAVEATGVHQPTEDGDWPYGDAPAPRRRAVTLTAIPYALWGNRGEGAMRVWLPSA